MKNLHSFLIFIMLASCHSKPEIDHEALAEELDSIFEVDQKYRKHWTDVQKTYGTDSKELNELREKQKKADSSNLIRIIEIIDRLGKYPGRSLVGNSAGKTAFYVLQHAPDSIQEKYYDLIIEAADNNELNKKLAAMYRDRYLMHKNRPQIFGTQVFLYSRIDSLTGQRIDSPYVWTIADTTNIDSLRLWNGLGPLEDYLNHFGISRWE